MKASLRFGILLISILAIGALVNLRSYLGEAHVERKPLKEFPQRVGTWQQIGPDTQLDSETLKVLRASDYLLRDYRRADGKVGNFYVGFYASQREGASFHSPLNCLPGAGWTLTEPALVNINLADGRSFEANKYVIQNGDFRSLMIYWYHGRGRSVASEYWGKVYTVIDSVRLRRSDGAMVRVTVPISGSETEALQTATDLVTAATASIGEFVP